MPLPFSIHVYIPPAHTCACVRVMRGRWWGEDPDVELCRPGVGVTDPALSWQVVFSRELRVLSGLCVLLIFLCFRASKFPQRGVCARVYAHVSV